MVTGKKGRKLLNLPRSPKLRPLEFAYKELKSKYGDHEAIMSVGGENFTLYKLNDKGNITAMFTGSKCASKGTIEFFLQQMKRMDIDLDDANAVGKQTRFTSFHQAAPVFCKSDCTHAQ